MASFDVNEALIQKWLEEGERIEACYLDVLKKNQVNDGLTNATPFFRRLYYHFHELTDAEVVEYSKILSRFERSKASGNAGKEVVKNFLGDCLTLLSTETSRQSIKKHLEKNGLMPEDTSEVSRREEEEARRRREEEEASRRQEEEEARRRQEEEEARRRQDDRTRQREEEHRRRAEQARKAAEQFEDDIDNFTAQRAQYVLDVQKKKKFNIHWKRVLKTLAILILCVLFFWLITLLKGYISSMRSSSARQEVVDSRQPGPINHSEDMDDYADSEDNSEY